MAAHKNPWAESLAGKPVGDFTLLKFVGAGKIGHVYKARFRDFPDDGVRAIKLTFDTLRPGWDVELRKVLRLNLHPNIVHFHQAGTATISHEGSTRMCQYTVWDYISPGENLRQYLKRTREIDAGFLFAVVERILHVLHSCEMEGVARHGDLHSGNILIGDQSTAPLDDSLQPRAPIYVSDFGYGATGGTIPPKDDYDGLSRIINEVIPYVPYSVATATHRQILHSMKGDLGKLLAERTRTERRSPLELLELLRETKLTAQAGGRSTRTNGSATTHSAESTLDSSNVGQFQVSEMIGERWDWWRHLFVPTVPARSKILALDIPTVVTGPRGCGKTMLFRRLSERLIVECGDVAELSGAGRIAALYVNANDFADAFAQYPADPSRDEEDRLICYANLCVLGDFLTVQSARVGRLGEAIDDQLLSLVHDWLVPDTSMPVLGPVNTIGRFVISLLDGAHRDAVRTHRALPPATAWQCQHAQFAGAQRDPVRRRAGVQVARVAEALWELAHDLHPYESLVQERGARPGLRTPATRPVDPYQAGGGVAGQHRRQGPSRRHGGSKKNGPQAIGKSRGGWTTKIHLVAADARTALTFALSPGQAHDSPEGRKLLASMGPQDDNVALVMDRAYQGDETRQLALDLGFTPVVPPLKTRTDPWEYDREMYKRRNEVERLFRRLKGYRRIFSRFEKLDVMFIGFIHFVLIFDALR